ncbi:CsgE family curli-type amyloid fiber assembly protein, partial [Escherichia coli]|uniref:CsgE family curli-type amyloid fiber assembly protein n=1 Tax=Escherichia coli TaxID=562 RepID=UPI0024E04440
YTGNLTINERPSARWGRWITITVNQDVIFQTFLCPLKRDFEKTVVFALIPTEEALKTRPKKPAILKKEEFLAGRNLNKKILREGKRV